MPTVAELDILIDATDRATDDLARIGAYVDSMGDRDLDIVVEALIADAMSDLAKVDGAVEALDGKDVNIPVKVDADGAGRSLTVLRQHMKNLANETANASRSMGRLAPALVALAPLLAPIGVVGVAGMAAFGGAVAGAATGVGLFGLVAGNVYKEVNTAVDKITQGEEQLKAAITDPAKKAALLKIEMAYAALSPAQRKAVEAQLAFNKSWDDFSNNYEGAIFEMIGKGLAGITKQMGKLYPIMDGVTAALDRLLDKALAALDGPVWSKFFDYLGRTAGPMVEAFGTTLGNLATGFASLLLAFEPLSKGFADGMVKMSEKFADWAAKLATSKEFQDFVEYIKTNGPVVLAVIGELARLFINLVEALMPIGEKVLPIVRDLLAELNKFMDAHPHITTTVLAMTAFVAAIIAATGPILAIIAAVRLIAAPFLWLAGTILPLVTGAFGALWPWLLRIGGFLLRFAGPVGAAIAAGILLYQNWDLIKAKAQELEDVIRVSLTGIKVEFKNAAIASGVWAVDTSAHMVATKNVVVTNMDVIKQAVAGRMAEVTAEFLKGFEAAKTTTSSSMVIITAQVVSGMNTVKVAAQTGMVSFVTEVVGGFGRARASAISGMADIVAQVAVGMSQVATRGREGIASFVASIAAGVGQAAGAAGRLASAVVGAVSGLAARMYQAGVNGVSGFVAGIVSGIGRVAAAASRLAAAAARALPGSPAETGPLSGRGYTLYRGQRLGDDLARGIASRAAAVAASTNRYADLIAAGLTANDARIATGVRGGGGALRLGGMAQAATDGSATNGGTAFTFNINNPIAEPTSVTTNKALQRVATLRLA